MTDKEFKQEFERLRNISQTIAQGTTSMNKAMMESLIEDSIDRLSAAGDSRCERTIEQLRVAAGVLRNEGLSNTERLKNSIDAAASGLAAVINARFDHVDGELDNIEDQISDTQDQIDDWGNRIMAVHGGDANPIVSIIVAILCVVLGTGFGIRATKVAHTFTQYLYDETGAQIMQNGKPVEVPALGDPQCTLVGIAFGLAIGFGVWTIYSGVICRIVDGFRSRAGH